MDVTKVQFCNIQVSLLSSDKPIRVYHGFHCCNCKQSKECVRIGNGIEVNCSKCDYLHFYDDNMYFCDLCTPQYKSILDILMKSKNIS